MRHQLRDLPRIVHVFASDVGVNSRRGSELPLDIGTFRPTLEPMFSDLPLYFAFTIPGLLLGLWAQMRVKRAFSKYERVPSARGMRGADVAAAILRAEGIQGVHIERSDGWLSDHYSPSDRTLRLSPSVFDGRTIAAAGVAAHEVGHAVQHARGYAPLGMRSTLVPAMQFASPLGVPMIMVGMLLSGWMGSAIGGLVALAGVGLFGVTVLFQLVTLPVEFDASKRALQSIRQARILSSNEAEGARSVLNAAAWTYVAAAVSSILTLLYFLVRMGLVGGRDD